MLVVHRILFSRIFVTATCFAQTDTGSLAGRVADPGDAPLSGAKVTLTNGAAGVPLPATTSQDDLYQYTSLRVSSLKVEQSGFNRSRQSGIVVSIATRSTLNVALAAGHDQQTVDATPRAPLMDTQTSDVGTIFQPKVALRLNF